MSLASALKFVVTHPINRSQQLRALTRVLKWQVGTRLIPGEVVFNWIDGTRFIVARGETGLTGNVYCGLHEFAEMAFVLHVLAPGDCFIDVGAHVGSYTILACGVRKAIGHCFEPVPSTFQRLMDNIRLNDLAERVTAYNCGVSDKEGELRFSIGENSTNHVVATREECADSVAVRVTSLNATLRGISANLMKIDVEGFETPVLRGAQELLSNATLHSVILEINGSGKRYGYTDGAILETMANYDFQEYRYDPFQRTLERADHIAVRAGNSIFVRAYDQVAERIASAPKFEIFGRNI